MDNSSSRRRFLQTLGLATGALAAGSFANAQEVAPWLPRKSPFRTRITSAP
ncbi:twin-arginine translocation signal domain-containing protein [Akkermansia muciniphila]|nr:twin-arginine translocation signal domain-containing protein [Akkermansia muciniphila]